MIPPIPAFVCAFAIDTSNVETKIEVRWTALAFELPTSGACPLLQVSTIGPFDAKSPTGSTALTADAEAALDGAKDATVKQQGRSILKRIRTALDAFNLEGLPPLRGTEHEDGSFSFEWRFADRRMAFTIERHPAESGWHLVSSRSSDDIQASGGLSEEDLRPLLGWGLRRTPSA